MKLLITGGAGFIGANFVHWCRHRRRDLDLVVLDALTHAGNRANLAAVEHEIRFVRGDVCDDDLVQRLLRDEAIDRIVHFAAESHVDRSIVAPDDFVRTNVVGTHTLLKAARAAWAAGDAFRAGVCFHHVSTDEVFGGLAPDAPPSREESAYAPSSPYSASKAAADHLVHAYQVTYGLPVTISRCSNNFGPYQLPEKLLPRLLTAMLEGRPLPVYGDGENVRDWLHVEDHCEALGRILERGRAGRSYNVGGGNPRRNIDVVRAMCASVDRRFAAEPELPRRFPACPAAQGASTTTLIRFVADRPGHDRRYAMDCTRVREELGFVAATRFEDGLERTVDWYLANEGWWRGAVGSSNPG